MTKRAIQMVSALFVLAVVAAAQAIPAGTAIPVRIGSELSSGTAKPGETFKGTVARDVVVKGQTIAKAGATVTGKVVRAEPSGRLHKPGVLSLSLTEVNGHPVRTVAVTSQGKSHTKGNAEKIGGGAVAGALIGGLAGGGKGAALGTLAGGAAGTGVAAYTGKEEAVVPAESALTFTVSSTGKSAAARRHK